jgi:hypothetical protein
VGGGGGGYAWSWRHGGGGAGDRDRRVDDRARPRRAGCGRVAGAPALKVYANLDERSYPKGIKITDSELAPVNITADPFHPEWNYTINPR